jgi:hypothetical protein
MANQVTAGVNKLVSARFLTHRANRANDPIGNSLLFRGASEQPIAKILETKFRTKYWKLSFEQQALLAIDKTYARLYVVQL